MVKNTHGGSGHKSQARKNVVNPKFASSKIRLRNSEEDEAYAQVLNVLGGGVCAVLCHDGQERLCIIRGKFRGRGKRDNMLYRGSWVLVALRTWAGTTKSGKEQCDLLEIYSDSDKKKLPTMDTSVNWTPFISNDAAYGFDKHDVNEEAGFVFADEKDEEYMELVSKAAGKTIAMNTSSVSTGVTEEEEIDIEDI